MKSRENKGRLDRWNYASSTGSPFGMENGSISWWRVDSSKSILSECLYITLRDQNPNKK